MNRPCGCRYVQVGRTWYHVVACPDHPMVMRPLARIELPEDAE